MPKTIPSHHYFPPHRSCFALDSSTASRCRESPCWKRKIIIGGEMTFKNQNWLKVVTYPWLTECAQNWTLKVGQRLPQLPFLQITRSLCTPISNTASISTNAANIPPNNAIFFLQEYGQYLHKYSLYCRQILFHTYQANNMFSFRHWMYHQVEYGPLEKQL